MVKAVRRDGKVRLATQLTLRLCFYLYTLANVYRRVCTKIQLNTPSISPKLRYHGHVKNTQKLGGALVMCPKKQPPPLYLPFPRDLPSVTLIPPPFRLHSGTSGHQTFPLMRVKHRIKRTRSLRQQAMILATGGKED